MRMTLAATMVLVQNAVAAPAPQSPAPAPVAAQEAVIPANWAAAPPPEKAVIQRAIKETFEEEKAMAEAQSKAAAIPQRYTMSSQPEQEKYEKFAEGFSEAKVPGCFSSNGLKHQPTYIFSGLLALPFVAVAAIRGKCN